MDDAEKVFHGYADTGQIVVFQDGDVNNCSAQLRYYFAKTRPDTAGKLRFGLITTAWKFIGTKTPDPIRHSSDAESGGFEFPVKPLEYDNIFIFNAGEF